MQLVSPSGLTSSAPNLAPTQAKYADKNPLVRFANQSFFRALTQMLGQISVHSILDGGCGEGVVTGRLRAPRIVGVDLDPKRAILARSSHPEARIAIADVQRLPFARACLDLVIMVEVFEHVGDPEAALKEVARVSRKYVLASVPNEPWWRIGNMIRLKYLRNLGNTPEHINHWSARGFTRFLSQSFTVLDLKKPFLWTFALAIKPQERVF